MSALMQLYSMSTTRSELYDRLFVKKWQGNEYKRLTDRQTSQRTTQLNIVVSQKRAHRDNALEYFLSKIAQ